LGLDDSWTGDQLMGMAAQPSPPRFPRFEIPGLVERPEWWRVRVDEIEEAIRAVRQGTVEQIATSANGHPVLAVAYGSPRPEPGTATWASASASGNMAAYKTRTDPQTFILLCGVHGAEAEGVCGAVNLISLLETGKDLRGREYPELVELCGQYRLVIVPCLNPDGREISPDHLCGASDEAFRRASQGVWKDGTAVGYPVCKRYAPLPLDEVEHPGGYPNGDGYNIQHDVAPGDLRTGEARGFLKLVADEQADFVLNMHSHGIPGRVLPASYTSFPLHVARTGAYMQRVHDDLAEAGLEPAPVMDAKGRVAININSAVPLVSGGMAITFEHPATDQFTFDQILEMSYVTIRCCLRYGLEEPFSPREAVARGRDG